MKTFFLILALLVFAAIAAFVLFMAVLYYVAKGEPDVNGDPERDAACPRPQPLPRPATEAEIKYVCGYCPPGKNFIRGNPNGIESHGCCDKHREALLKAEVQNG